MSETMRLVLAVVLSVGVIMGWGIFLDKNNLRPKPDTDNSVAYKASHPESVLTPPVPVHTKMEPREDILRRTTDRLPLESSRIKGSISLKGLFLDDVALLDYKETIDPESANIKLLSPAGSADTYFVDFGWISSGSVVTPDASSTWSSDVDSLKAGQAANLMWDNGKGLVFKTRVELDDGYMFTITQEVISASGADVHVPLVQYSRITKLKQNTADKGYVANEGVSFVMKSSLYEYSYSKIEKKGFINVADVSLDNRIAHLNRWFGFTDKYWLAAIVPSGNDDAALRMSYANNLYGVVAERNVMIGDSKKSYVFVGAKELDTLEGYGKDLGIFEFDRAVDFGSLYFITKPILKLLLFFNNLTHNFGFAIMLLTVVVRLLLFPIVNKSYYAMNKMKKLQPELEKIRRLHEGDKQTIHRETMALYQAHNMNPMSGCLPFLIQIPVFFALYKVLYVSLDMRHAPFFGWISDLSAPDPVNVFDVTTLVGLPALIPSFVHIGAWPLIFGLTMIVQQKLQSSNITDPTQASIMRLMPYIFVFMFSKFPVGLIIYWSWNNMLSMTQQFAISKIHRDKR